MGSHINMQQGLSLEYIKQYNNLSEIVSHTHVQLVLELHAAIRWKFTNSVIYLTSLVDKDTLGSMTEGVLD